MSKPDTQALIDLLNTAKSDGQFSAAARSALNEDAFEIITYLLAQIPEWISVSDRLPENEGLYLINVREYFYTDESGDDMETPRITNDVDFAEFKNGTLVPMAYEYGVHVTSWMPLPPTNTGGE